MGLSFFQGNRKATKIGSCAIPDAASEVYQQFPSPSTTTINPPGGGVPVAYFQPQVPTDPSDTSQQRQQQLVALPQQLPPNDDNTNLPTQYNHHNGYGYNSNPGVMIISNAEVDHNLRIGLQSRFRGRTLLHKVFIILSIVTILTAINNIIAHTLAVIFYGTYDDAMEDILRLFTIGLYLLVILIEMNRSILVQQSFVFQHWAARGVLYMFLGVLSTVEYDVGSQNYGSYRDRYNQHSYGRNHFVIYVPSGEDALELYVWATGIVMLFIGIIYVILGACCLHHKYQQMETLFEQQQRRLANNSLYPPTFTIP
jgi:hypothetical protein